MHYIRFYDIILMVFKIKIHCELLPSTPFGKAIGSPFSRRHKICGGGAPVATHRIVTFDPSLTTYLIFYIYIEMK